MILLLHLQRPRPSSVHARRRQDMHVVHHPSEHILITKAVFVPVEEIFEGVERLVVHSLVKISTTDVC